MMNPSLEFLIKDVSQLVKELTQLVAAYRRSHFGGP